MTYACALAKQLELPQNYVQRHVVNSNESDNVNSYFDIFHSPNNTQWEVCLSWRCLFAESQCIGIKITDCVPLFNKKVTGEAVIYPEGVSFDINEQKITGITFTFGRSLRFEEVENEVDKFYKRWSAKRFEAIKKNVEGKEIALRIWRVASGGFTIQLSTDDEGKVVLIYLKWLPTSAIIHRMK